MSKISRYNLLISVIRHGLRYKHNLSSDRTEEEYNCILIQRAVEAWIFLTEDLMCENDLPEQARDTRIATMLKFIQDHHISFTLKILKSGYDILINHISLKRVLIDYSDFKGQFDEIERDLIGLLFSPIKESLNAVISSQTFVSNGVYHSICKRDMWICAHYLQFLNKLNFKGIGLEETALADYMSSEMETSQWCITECEPYIPAIQNILKNWMKDWDYDGLRPKHGPGSVADTKRSKLLKYYRLAADSRLRYLYGEDDLSIFPKWRSQHFERTSKLVFVPKNITKLRSISMEPATLQYIQQGCMESLYDYFKESPILKNILKLSDQSQNKSFAYHGSITNDYATIDLSHASDSVNWMLTKRLFSRVPKLLKWLICTRSTHTLLPDGQTIELSKFAPMGSALCFPVESLIFAAIAELSIKLSKEQGADRNNDTGIRVQTQFLTVYGDDIIIPTYAAAMCIELLRVFGFSPNEEKSYLSGPFKESCGGNYFCGYDITPIKFSPKVSPNYKIGISPQAYTALCSYANLAYSRGLSMFRLYCIKTVFEAGLQPLFTDNLEQSPAIFSSQPTNFHLKKKYVKRYQKFQYIYTGTKAVEVEEPKIEHLDEEIFLFDKLLAVDKKKEDCHLPSINASVRRGVLVFDINTPYSRSTLHEQTTKYSLCFQDI